jgi:phospholipase/lecithinase/hemolysin
MERGNGGWQRRAIVRASRRRAAAAAAAAAAILAACASVQPAPRVISFGDSLSDLGTYKARTEGRTAGRFTTNPGPIWVEIVAAEMGGSVTGYRQAGWGRGEHVLGGLAYAEGGSRVTEQPGSNNTDATAGTGSGQISTHLQRDEFRAQDVVLVWAGANDIFRHALFAPAPTAEAGESQVRDAARSLAAEVRRIVAAGQPRVVVLTIDDYGETPSARNGSNREKLSRWSNAFNADLTAGLQGTPVRLVDTNRLLREVRNDPARFKLQQGLAPACALNTLPQRSVAFCSAETLVAPDAHLTHLYADGVHLTTAGHRLVAQEALRAIRP